MRYGALDAACIPDPKIHFVIMAIDVDIVVQTVNTPKESCLNCAF